VEAGRLGAPELGTPESRLTCAGTPGGRLGDTEILVHGRRA